MDYEDTVQIREVRNIKQEIEKLDIRILSGCEIILITKIMTTTKIYTQNI